MKELGSQWRSDIAALRGISVLLVILNHASIPGFSFGFIGVDLFFVISGYLITRSLYIEYLTSNIKKNGRGSIKILRFYLRRIRRLMPAALTVILIVNLVSSLFFSESEQISLFTESIASLFLTVNTHFIAIDLDYFKNDSSPSFLLHYWSLSVEEQFYLLMPLLILLCAFSHRLKFQEKYLRFNFRLLTLLSVICISSFLLLQMNFDRYPTESYFSLLFRAWELGVGALFGVLAYHKKRSANFSNLEKIIPLIGSIVVTSIFISPHNWARFMAFPVLATGFFLYVGENQITSDSEKLRKKSIYFKLLLFFGKISYSLYLVHWPIILLVKKIFPYNGYLEASISVGASIIFGNLLWAYIEIPFQRIPITKKLDNLDILVFDWARKRKEMVFGLPLLLILALYLFTFPSNIQWLTQGSSLRNAAEANRFLKPFADYEQKLVQGADMNTGSEQDSTTTQLIPSSSSIELLQNSLKDLQQAKSLEIKNALTQKNIPAPLLSTLPFIGEDKNSYEKSSCPNIDIVQPPSSCIFVSPKVGTKKRLVVVGDSKISQYFDSINTYFLSKNWDVYSYAMNGCDPLAPTNLRKSCMGRLDWVAKQVEKENFDLMIFAGYPAGNITSSSQNYLIKLIKDSKKSILLSVTAKTPDPKTCITASRTIPNECIQILSRERIAELKISSIYYALQSNSVGYIDTRSWLCIDMNCPILIGNTFTTRDGSHLTRSYVKKIEPIFYANLDLLFATLKI